MMLACAVLHFGEEPPLTGRGGSGALFFSGCTMRCGFCQNRQLSRGEVGRGISGKEFTEICLELQQRGAENINLVSATPFIPSIDEGLQQARREGLHIPVVWNSSGYETTEQVERLADFVDIFLPDLKLLDSDLAGRLFGAGDYPERAQSAVRRMADLRPAVYADGQAGEPGKLVSGTIVRHLVLPGLLEQTKLFLEWFARELEGRAVLSLMLQFYVPAWVSGWRRGVEALENRSLHPREYERILEWLDEYGIEDGFIQEYSPDEGAEEHWWPDFRRPNPFPEEYSKPVWTWSSNPARSQSREIRDH